MNSVKDFARCLGFSAPPISVGALAHLFSLPRPTSVTNLLRQPLAWVRINFAMQHQQQSNWCWAAVAHSVSAYFNAATGWTQCGIVNAELGRSDCCTQGSSSYCNVSWYLDLALTRTGNLHSWGPGIEPMATIADEINNSRPLCARIGWSGGGGHVCAIDGFNCDLGLVAVADPWYGLSTITLATFQTAYRGSGSWTHTYFVQS